MDPVAFTIFGHPIRWYGIIICLGFIAAAAYCSYRARDFGLTADNVTDFMLWLIPICVIGARAYYVLNRWDTYKDHPEDIIKIWEGGIAIYGGIIAGALAAALYCKIKKVNFLSLGDVAVLGLLTGQFIGRWGNFVNAEAYGTATSLPWGMSINGAPPCHPTFLYESLWNFALFIFLHFYSKKRKFKGELILLYFSLYGLGRAWIEGLRTDSLYVGNTNIRISQLLAVCFFVICAGALVYLRIRKNYEKYDLLSLNREN
ncbi:MAG: prolipoprotein diacylglyceryl transferase [Clostridia bacterium]|nr:prolipoprotein diacylglyceryl transferase [Clostridia bacterium]